MPLGSFLGGIIGQQGAQQGGDMAWAGANAGNRQNLEAANRAYAEAQRARNALSPWTSLGLQSVNKLANIYGFGHTVDANGDGNVSIDGSSWKADQDKAYADFRTSPGYRFRVDEGVRGLDRSAASRGLVLSGAQKKGVEDYSQGRASDEWGNYINALSGFSGQGSGAASSANASDAAFYGQAGNLIGQGSNLLYQGDAARGSAYAAGANALASGIGKGVQNAVSIGAYKGWI